MSSNSVNWKELLRHYEVTADLSLHKRFDSDPARAKKLGFECGDLWIDVAKQKVDTETIDLLFDLAEEQGVTSFFHSMSFGEVVNLSEARPALHTFLRRPLSEENGEDLRSISENINETFNRMNELAEKIKSKQLLGFSGKVINSVINLGIGGSHLGPFMAFEALQDYVNPEIEMRWSSGLDAADLDNALQGLDPESTIVIICSKTFSTSETISAANRVLNWLSSDGVSDPTTQVFAATASPEKALSFGVVQENIFSFSESVGGRFSLASPVALGLMISIGCKNFEEMLNGMNIIDRHVLEVTRNIPMLLGLIDVWNNSIIGTNSLAIVPYSYRLRYFPSHLQQLMMESLGKSVSSEGESLKTKSGVAVFGASGTDAQHSFFQMLHQGTETIPLDLIGFARLSDETSQELIANLIAQAETLAFGQDTDEKGIPLLPHKILPGDKPSTVILAPDLSPSILGQLVALYEHRTVSAGVVLGINPFDQWGVEFGKQAAKEIANELQSSKIDTNRDDSTQTLMKRYSHWRDGKP